MKKLSEIKYEGLFNQIIKISLPYKVINEKVKEDFRKKNGLNITLRK